MVRLRPAGAETLRRLLALHPGIRIERPRFQVSTRLPPGTLRRLRVSPAPRPQRGPYFERSGDDTPDSGATFPRLEPIVDCADFLAVGVYAPGTRAFATHSTINELVHIRVGRELPYTYTSEAPAPSPASLKLEVFKVGWPEF